MPRFRIDILKFPMLQCSNCILTDSLKMLTLWFLIYTSKCNFTVEVINVSQPTAPFPLFYLHLCSQCHGAERREILVNPWGLADEQGPYVPHFLPRWLCGLHWQTNSPKQFWKTLDYRNSLLVSRGGSCHVLVIFITLLWGMKLYCFISVIN